MGIFVVFKVQSSFLGAFCTASFCTFFGLFLFLFVLVGAGGAYDGCC